LRNGVGDKPFAVKVAMADDDDVVYPLIGNDDLITAMLLLEDDDDIRDDTAALLGIVSVAALLRSIWTTATAVEGRRWRHRRRRQGRRSAPTA